MAEAQVAPPPVTEGDQIKANQESAKAKATNPDATTARTDKQSRVAAFLGGEVAQPSKDAGQVMRDLAAGKLIAPGMATRGAGTENNVPATTTIDTAGKPSAEISTIQDALNDLANSPEAAASAYEEAAIARAKTILNPEATIQTIAPAEQQNADKVTPLSAPFHEPTADQRAAGQKVEPINGNTTPAEVSIATTADANPPTEQATIPTAQTEQPTTTAGESPADKPVATENPTTTTEATATPSAETATAPEQTQAEQLVRMAEIGGKLTELGIDLGSKQGKDILQALGENPTLVDSFKDRLDNAKQMGSELAGVLKNHGIELTDGQATAAALDMITQQLGGEIAKQTAEAEAAGSDQSQKDIVAKKNSLFKLLKILAVALALVVTSPITVPVLAGYGLGSVLSNRKG